MRIEEDTKLDFKDVFDPSKAFYVAQPEGC